jgi:hypothetical protein
MQMYSSWFLCSVDTHMYVCTHTHVHKYIYMRRAKRPNSTTSNMQLSKKWSFKSGPRDEKLLRKIRFRNGYGESRNQRRLSLQVPRFWWSISCLWPWNIGNFTLCVYIYICNFTLYIYIYILYVIIYIYIICHIYIHIYIYILYVIYTYILYVIIYIYIYIHIICHYIYIYMHPWRKWALPVFDDQYPVYDYRT